jgi:ferredoxin-NADP reductase
LRDCTKADALDALHLIVTETAAATQDVRALRLARPDGGKLPPWDAGAHIDIALPGGDMRSYSLVNASRERAATLEPQCYRIGVRLEETSRGGSQFIHGLRIGDGVNVSLPSNNFALQPSEQEIVLVAGGIGVTPILSMAAELAATGRRFRLIYAGRCRAQLPFLNEVEAMSGGHIEIHCDDERCCVFDMRTLMKRLVNDEPLYVCGPTPMIDAAIAQSQDLRWAPGRLRFEIFTRNGPHSNDTAFEVVLNGSGRTFVVPPNKTILDVLLEAGEDPLFDCKRGDCGICQVSVIEGIPDHRDYVLTPSERASNKLMQICISRAKTPRLVLDL